MYDPTLGRFAQRDPLGHLAGMNLYQYVNGNPAGFLDPVGLLVPLDEPGPPAHPDPDPARDWVFKPGIYSSAAVIDANQRELARQWGIPALLKALESESFQIRKQATEKLESMILDPKTMYVLTTVLKDTLATKPTLELTRRVECLLQRREQLRRRIHKLLHAMCLEAAITHESAKADAQRLAGAATRELTTIIREHYAFVAQLHQTGSIYKLSEDVAQELSLETPFFIRLGPVEKCLDLIRNKVGSMLAEELARRRPGN
jgi:hypothetical protein